MKNSYLIILLVTFSNLNAQIINFPDSNFKDFLVNSTCVDFNGNGVYDSDADTNDDGEIQVSEAEAVLRLLVNSSAVSSVEGIEYFTNLEILTCQNTQVTNLDLSQNINLLEITCILGIINTLNISNCTDLQFLFCAWNELTNIDVTQNPNLGRLFCYSNQLTNIDVTQNTQLIRLVCQNNALEELDISQNLSLRELVFSANQISNIDVTNNQLLQRIVCNNNQLTSLDLSQNTSLEGIDCSSNSLTSLNIKNGNNQIITKMYSQENPNLECIQVDDESANYPDCDFVNATGWCKDTNAQYNESCILGIEDNVINSVNLFPNPSQNEIIISSNKKLINVKIYSLQGRFIKETNSSKINISNFSKGLYLVYIFIENNIVVKKFIKQ